MLDFEKSFFVKHWEFVVLFISIVYFCLRLRDNNRGSSNQQQQQQQQQVRRSDDETIANDYRDDDDGLNDDLTPSLENVDHVRFKGASVVLKGGVNEFYNLANDRRSIRNFSNKPVDIEIVKKCIHAAGTAPSGAHTEPWTFCCVSSDAVKLEVREIIELEEFTNYQQRMSKQWTADLKPLRTNHVKEYLTDAPHIILVFKQVYGMRADGNRKTHYYNEISTAIAVGILLSALQSAGLSSLTTTPLNCGPALRTLLNRPANEKLMVVLPVGYPAADCEIPNLQRKPLEEILALY